MHAQCPARSCQNFKQLVCNAHMPCVCQAAARMSKQASPTWAPMCPAANLLKPMLARGELHCIGATTLAEYRLHMEKDAAFERRFQQVLVGEPSVEVGWLLGTGKLLPLSKVTAHCPWALLCAARLCMPCAVLTTGLHGKRCAQEPMLSSATPTRRQHPVSS